MIVKLEQHGLLIDGEWRETADKMDVINPATDEVTGRVSVANEAAVDAAVDSARKAFPGWSSTSSADRRAALHQLGSALLERQAEVAAILTSEQGKPIAEAEGEVAGAAFWLQGTAQLDLDAKLNEDSTDRLSETTRIPLGVVGGIPAWNFPLFLAALKIAPALVTGNTLVLKPSPFTPLSTLALGEIARSILPPGVLNIVTGNDDLGPMLTAHSGIDKISFTGSTQTGRKVMASASKDLKRITLELGGNDAAIVMPDVDLDDVVPKLFWSAFRNNGQVCTAAKRLYVHDDIYDRFLDALVAFASTVSVGNGAKRTNELGPLSNRPQYDRVMSIIARCRADGHRFAFAGRKPSEAGLFIAPVIVDNPPDDSQIVTEEQFGPVLPVLRYREYEDVLKRANATGYGLSGSVWGGDEKAAYGIASGMIAGTIWVNHMQFLSPAVPFGGMKLSGLGVEGGTEGLLEYTAPRTIVRGRS